MMILSLNPLEMLGNCDLVLLFKLAQKCTLHLPPGTKQKLFTINSIFKGKNVSKKEKGKS